MSYAEILVPSVRNLFAALGVAIACFFIWIIKAIFFPPPPPKLDFPVASIIPGNLTDSILAARKQWPTEPFVLPMKPQSWVMLPHSMMTEIKSQPEEKVSFKKMSYERFLGDYTGLGQSKSPAAINAIKIDLTRSVKKILQDLQDEAEYSFNKEIGVLPTWTSLPVYMTFINIVAACSGRAFVGLPLCRDKEWRDATINFTYDTLGSVHAMKKYNKALWPFVARFVPELRKLKSYREFAARKLDPQIQTIIRSYKDKSMGLKSDEANADMEAIKHNYNLVHWTIGQHDHPELADAAEVGQMQMTAAFAALSPIGMSISYAIFDLASHPEYADELRKEINDVLAQEKPENGQLQKSSLPKLRKLDSFMKESQRLNPPFITTNTRVVTAPDGLTLSSGHTIPQNVIIAFGNPFLPNSEVQYPPLTSPSQPPLSNFYPWRYSDLRQIPGEENAHQFVTADANNPSFGYGRHACPGRFFASNEIKVLIVELLRRYDVALGPDGEGVKEGFERPKTLEMGFAYAANPKAKVYFRSRV
ncbi:Cytochrome P450 [Glarea lozoyensis ATCC 20868]|uniref:Cytochrome P450 n=1 Tax=Glarea lozoyensis (strain ATCC 20868 / MF5171) TaxID=1116229 RepID=S3CWH3_GLAL2|nr:Cytochrome P450 [Glarea lozoyensis ATCC 20868]EPE30000.1 Cytochrome P450 [Glarea lozoyensis ATCC 20868]